MSNSEERRELRKYYVIVGCIFFVSSVVGGLVAGKFSESAIYSELHSGAQLHQAAIFSVTNLNILIDAISLMVIFGLLILLVAILVGGVITIWRELLRFVGEFRIGADSGGWLAVFAAATAMMLYMGTNDWLMIERASQSDSHLGDGIGNWSRVSCITSATSTFLFAILIGRKTSIVKFCFWILLVSLFIISVFYAVIYYKDITYNFDMLFNGAKLEYVLRDYFVLFFAISEIAILCKSTKVWLKPVQ